MSGKMWRGPRGAPPCPIGRFPLFEDVTFGWGLLGRLKQRRGIVQTQSRWVTINWKYDHLTWNVCHAYFQEHYVTQFQTDDGFHRISDTMTISEAYQLLEKARRQSRPNPMEKQMLQARNKHSRTR